MARTPSSPTAPRVSEPDIPEDLLPAVPARRARLHAARLDLGGHVDLAHAELDQCAVVVNADHVDLTGATLSDVDVTDARATSFVMRNANLRRVRFRGGRIGTLDLSGTRIDELELSDLRVDYLTFGAARGHDISITSCSFRALDTPQADLARLAFKSSRADEFDTAGLRASDVDLRGLDTAAYLDTNSLRGTTMSVEQVERIAVTLARTAGINVTL